jgi:hypothetical protein
MYHYVYVSFEDKPSGKSYIGVHSTCDILDVYLGSYSDEAFNPTHKIILQHFSSREAAVQAEIQWQKVFRVAHDPQYANRAYQTSEKFDTTGATLWHDSQGRHTLSHSDPGPGWIQGASPSLRKTRSDNSKGPKNPAYGKKQSQESNSKRSEALKGSKNHNYGKPRPPEVCEKISKTKSGVPTGSVWWVNCNVNQETHSQDCPGEGWTQGRLRRKWWVDSEGRTKHSVESPGPDWKEGRRR